MICTSCGNQNADNANNCTSCGALLNQAPQQQQTQPTYTNYQQQGQPQYNNYQQPPVAAAEDKGGFLWGLLGCCIPVAGLILFIIWKNTKPKTAKAAGIGALICTVLYVIYLIIMIATGALSQMMYLM